MRKFLLFLLISSAWGSISHAQTNTSFPRPVFTPDALELGHGVNLGNMLEALHEGDWGVRLHADYFPTIRKAGFTLIRLPIRWAAHVSTAPDFTIDPMFFGRIDWAVAQAKKKFFWVNLAPSIKATSIPACAGRRSSRILPRPMASHGLTGNFPLPLASSTR